MKPGFPESKLHWLPVRKQAQAVELVLGHWKLENHLPALKPCSRSMTSQAGSVVGTLHKV